MEEHKIKYMEFLELHEVQTLSALWLVDWLNIFYFMNEGNEFNQITVK